MPHKMNSVHMMNKMNNTSQLVQEWQQLQAEEAKLEAKEAKLAAMKAELAQLVAMKEERGQMGQIEC